MEEHPGKRPLDGPWKQTTTILPTDVSIRYSTIRATHLFQLGGESRCSGEGEGVVEIGVGQEAWESEG